ncbi:MAG: hypothetical protein U9O82_04690 [Thermodesulfobacteriota bacterium]|nr:hypothetical protein [Thermodesulfobacteriota bacterium]
MLKFQALSVLVAYSVPDQYQDAISLPTFHRLKISLRHWQGIPIGYPCLYNHAEVTGGTDAQCFSSARSAVLSSFYLLILALSALLHAFNQPWFCLLIVNIRQHSICTRSGWFT